MKRLTNIARPDQTGNAPGLLRLRLLHARDVLGLADPRSLVSHDHELYLPPGGLELEAGTELVDVPCPAGQLSYTEQLQTVKNSRRWMQAVSFALPDVTVDRVLTAQVISKGRWLAVVYDANERCRLVGRPEQPLVCTSVHTSPNSCALRLECMTADPAFFLDEFYDLFIFNEMSKYKYQVVNILEVRRGDTFEVNLLLAEDIVLTGGTLRAQVRRYPADPVVALELDLEVDGLNLMLGKEASAMTIPGGIYVFDVEFVDAENKTHTLFGGKFEVLQDVTR